jgi:hypothetical protein
MVNITTCPAIMYAANAIYKVNGAVNGFNTAIILEHNETKYYD